MSNITTGFKAKREALQAALEVTDATTRNSAMVKLDEASAVHLPVRRQQRAAHWPEFGAKPIHWPEFRDRPPEWSQWGNWNNYTY